MASGMASGQYFIRLLIVILVCAAIAGAVAVATASNSILLYGLPAMLVLAIISFGIQFIAFIPAYLLQTEKFYDLVGSLSFISLAMVCIVNVSKLSWYQIALASMILIWALRLGAFLFIRVMQDGADDRFDHIKPSPSRFLTAWTIQGLWVFLSSASVTAALVSTQTFEFDDSLYNKLCALGGILLWLIGFVIEVIADWQKRQFKKQQNRSRPFICSGLWRYSRHPNYFGEIILWVGAALFALPALSDWQHIVLISPIFVSLLLIKISGVPMLEAKADKRFAGLPEYQQYKNETPVLVPNFR